MPDQIESFKVVCKGGLNSNENHLDLSEEAPGSAVRLVNYEPSLFGGYRRLEGYTTYNSLYQEVDPVNAEGQIMSLSFFRDDVLKTDFLLATRKVKKFKYTATAGQTVFSGSDDNVRTMDLPVANNTWAYITPSGSAIATRKFLGSDFSVSGNQVTFTTPLNVGDTVEIDPQEYCFYYYATGWQKINLTNTVLGTTARRASVLNQVTPITKVRDTTFNFGSGNSACFVDGANPAIIYDGVDWVELTSSGGGTKALGAGGNQCLNFPAIVDVFKNHLFLSGDATNASVVCHSAASNPYDFVAASSGGVQTGGVQLLPGFDLVDFRAFRDNLFFFGTNAIKKVIVDVTAGFVIEQVTNNVGCIARDSVLEIGGDLIFLAPDGIRPVAGTSRIGDVELETISKPIQQLLTQLPANYDLNSIVGVVLRSKSQIRYFIQPPSIADAEDSFGIIGALRSADQRLGWEFGETLGIRASAACSQYINNEEVVLHGDYDGKVYQQERGTDFGGNDILAIYASPFFDFGETEVRKDMRKLNTFIRCEGPLDMNIAINYDWYDQRSAKPGSYLETSSGAPVTYRGLNINYASAGVSYGGSDAPIMRTDIQGSGYATQVTYVTLGKFEPYSIQGLVFEFSVAGRL